MPWFDKENAHDLLLGMRKSGTVNSEQFALLEKWIQDGYFVIDQLVDGHRIREFREAVEGVWTRAAPYANLNIMGVTIDGKMEIFRPHEEILNLPQEKKETARRESSWRIPGFHLVEEAANDIFEDKRALEYCELIFGRKATPRYSLTFHKGSQQALHQDTAVFCVYPRNNLIGVWIAAEQTTEECGPLLYCPGSHREPLYPGFSNYPQTCLKTCTSEEDAEYHKYVADLAQTYERKSFLAKPGDALFWHGQLIHGGKAVEDANSTRLSFVIHYIADGADVISQIKGPFRF